MTTRTRSLLTAVIVLAFVVALLAGFPRVTKGAVETELEITADPSLVITLGEAVTITWTLDAQTDSEVTFAGTLTRCVKSPSWVSGPCDVLAGGVATSGGDPFESEYFFAPPTAGTYTIQGSYEGCTICGPNAPELDPCSDGPVNLTVNQAGTTTSVVSDLNPSAVGVDVTFTATVTAVDPILQSSGPAIGGTADFYIDDALCVDCTNVAVNNGVATCTYDFSSEGDGFYDIYVVYDGDTNYATSTSASITQHVLAEPVGTTTTLTSDPASISPPPDTELVVGQTVAFIATVTVASGTDTPTGTVDFYRDGTTYLGSATLVGVAVGEAEAELELTTGFDSVSSFGVTADYTGVPGNFESSTSDPLSVVVSAASTGTSVTDQPDPSVLGQPYQVEGTVSVAFPGDGHPTGTVTVTDAFGNSCIADVDPNTGDWSCTITVTQPTTAGTNPLSAVYSGDANFLTSTNNTEQHTYTDPTTRTEVMGADTPLIVGNIATFEVHVVDVSDPSSIPPGTVTISVDPAAQGVLNIPGPPYDVTLDAAGRCTFTYTPTSAATTPHVFTASYNGEDDPDNGWFHEPSKGTYAQQIVRRAADMTLTLGPTTAYIDQPVTVTVRVEDDTTEGTPTIPSGTVTFADGGKYGEFSVGPHTLDGNGECTVTYIPYPYDAGPTTITATYDGSDVHTGKSASTGLAVELRPVEVYVACSQDMLFVNETYTGCTITVKDVGEEGTATPPGGAISALTTVLSPDSVTYNLSAPNPSLTDPETEWTFDYLCTGLDPEAEAGYDTITAEFTASDGIHASTSGAFIQPLAKRYTITTLTGYGTAAGVTCTATVEEDPSNDGIPVPIAGKFVLVGNPDEEISSCTGLSGASPSCTFDVESSALLANVTVKYVPSDGVHLASTASANISRADQPEFDPDPVPPNPDDYNDCADGCGSGGVNVDQIIFNLNAADVALAAVQMGLEVASIALDLIPDGVVTAGIVVQSGVTIPWSDVAAAIVSGSALALEIARTAMTTDLDGDGLPDTVEQTVTDTDYTKTDTDGDGLGDYDEISECGGYYGGSLRPNPNDPDSDDDGLLDGEEVGYNTNFCVADTDCDTVSDGDEVDTWGCGDPRDHANPLVLDTDGDGLDDNIELSTYPACASCPYVNDDDSDDDGLQDGYEDTNASGSYEEASDVSDLCVADTDEDGLLDGVEVGLGTDPENQDTDGDGLSDFEEVHATQTDPLDVDSDNDDLYDDDEVFVLSGTYPNRSFDQESNPLDPDTDDDGIRDNKEFPGGTVGGTVRDTTCPYVNDDDSDDDGLQDGYEDDDHDGVPESTDHDGIWNNYTLPANGSTGQGSGETNPCDPDTDNDGLSDGEEAGLFVPVGGTGSMVVSTTAGDTVPALDDDSDNDGLSDYEEVNITGTNALDADTDDDNISDANELIATGGTWPKRELQQESDPLDPDTDDDILQDDMEYRGTAFEGTGLGITRTSGGTPDNICPYVNDDDSDDDGLQDGYEDDDHDGVPESTDHDGIWNNYTLPANGSTGQGSGETNPCDPDTDNDGLSDGEEAGLFVPVGGTGSMVVSTTAGNTVPALDDDSDNDGLSDYEEVNITGTNALDADTDDDNISDANELIATGGTWPKRDFNQESDPLDPDTDDDYLPDDMEWRDATLTVKGTNLGDPSSAYWRLVGGDPDNRCPYVNDDDSDDDGLQDGVEDANKDGTYGDMDSGMIIGTIGGGVATAKNGAPYWETDLCNPDTDGDGLLDGEEVSLLGGEPLSGRPGPGETFTTVTPQGKSTELPSGTGPAGSPPGTKNSQLGPYTFTPMDGAAMGATIPALDVDSDDDGLSDYEEVNITQTNPLDQDTDNDTLMDSDELIAIGGTTGGTPQRTFDQESDPLDINTDDDHLFDPQEYYNAGQYGSGLSGKGGGAGGDRDTFCPYVNDDDSDDDGIQDGKAVPVDPALTITGSGAPPLGYDYSYTHYEDFIDVPGSDPSFTFPGIAASNVGDFNGEQRDDALPNVCDSDSDGDGLNDGEEVAIGTNPDDCDTDNDGRNDWHEHTGGGPIPTDPFDPDTDDDGLLDSAEVFGSNTTNPVNADTDGDGLCDGGTGTPWMTSLDPRVIVNPICKACAVPGLGACGGPRTGSVDGIGDHPNPHGYGEDKNGNGAWDGTIGQLWASGAPGAPETDPNQYDTDGDADGDGVEVLGFSTSRQFWIPTVDLFGRTINVTYPACGCLEPLIADTDGDQLDDGYEDRNHDGNFDFLPSEFDHEDPLPGPPIPYPTETNPCNPDTDDDDLTDYEERYQSQVYEFYANWDNDGDGVYNEDPVDGIDNDGDGKVDEDPLEPTFNPTNPLDHDTDNDRIYDGPEVKWVCTAITFVNLDNDVDGLIDEDPVDGLDNDGDGLFDEDDVDFFVRFVPMLDPTNRDSDSDGWLDGLDADPCNSDLIPIFLPPIGAPVDSDGDGFEDEDEEIAGTHPLDPDDHPIAYVLDLDFDTEIDDRLWLEPTACCGVANSVAIDIDCNVLIDARVQIVKLRHAHLGDFDEDGFEDDCRYVIEYAFANYRVLQPRIVATIDDFDCDMVIDWVVVEKK